MAAKTFSVDTLACERCGASPLRVVAVVRASTGEQLEAVGHPVAVNPERELRKVAEERQWPMLEFQRQVSLRTRLAQPVPIISGATAMAGIAGGIALWLVKRRNA